MINYKNITLYIISAFLLSACNNEEGNNSENGSEENQTYQNTDYQNGELYSANEIPFKGGVIHLAEEGNGDQIYTIPEVKKKKQDIYFSAQRIPSELYLKNKGVSENELAEALSSVAGEQLFYFEFQEEQKQDLVKKYFEEDMDGNISYLSFGIHNDFQLIKSNGDTISSDYSVYERNYNVAPYERILVSFSGIDQNEEVRLLYNDILFGKGKLDFAFASTHYLENNTKNPS